MPVPFDTHAAITDLENAGFPAPQATALSHLLLTVTQAQRNDLVTKADLNEGLLRLEVKLETFKGEITRQFEAFRGEIHSELKPLRWTLYALAAAAITYVLKAIFHL